MGSDEGNINNTNMNDKSYKGQEPANLQGNLSPIKIKTSNLETQSPGRSS